MNESEMIKFARLKRDLMRTYRQVPIQTAHSKLYRPSDEPDEDDVGLDASGSKLLEELREKFISYEDPYYKERLVTLWGRSYIENQIYSFVRKQKYVRNIPHDLLRAKKDIWTVFIGLKNLHLKKDINFALAILHPPGVKSSKLVTNKVRKSFEEFSDSPYIEIRGIEAPTLGYASIKALDIAKSCLSLIPNKFGSLSYREDIKFSGYIIGYNQGTQKWDREWNITHKGLVLGDYEETVLKSLGPTIKSASKRKSDFSKRILDITSMFFSAKSVLHPPAKLLLLATVLESLLLEETFNSTVEYKRQNERAERDAKKKKKSPTQKVKKGVFFSNRLRRFVDRTYNVKNNNVRSALSFLTELYNHRSEVTHLCKKHRLDEEQVRIVENIALTLIKKISDAKAKTHLAALRKIKAVEGKI